MNTTPTVEAQVLAGFVRRGVEHEKTVKALLRHFNRKYNIVFAQIPSGAWIARSQRNRQEIGRYDDFATMIVALLEGIEERD